MIPKWLKKKLEFQSFQNDFINHLDDLYEDCLTEAIWEKNFPDEELPNWFKEVCDKNFFSSWIYSFLKNGDEELVELWLKNGLLKDDPIWLDELIQKHQNDVARVFLVSGNVNDYSFSPLKGYMPIIDLIEETIRQNGQVVIRYSLSNHFGNIRELEKYNRNNEPTKKLKTFLEGANNGNNSTQVQIWQRIQQDFEFINDLLKGRSNEGVCLIVEHADMLFPNEARELERNALVEFLLNWAVAPWMYQSKNQVILTTEAVNEISNNLKSQTNKIEIINIKRPDTIEERLKFLISVYACENPEVRNQDNIRIMTGFEFPDFPELGQNGKHYINRRNVGLNNTAEKSSGLNYLGIEDLLLQTRNNKGKLSISTITNVKGKILQEESSGLIELLETDKTFNDVGGFDSIKNRLSAISDAMLSNNGLSLITRTIPMGILFLGPPGTGKTLIAKAFANMCNTNFVKLGDFRSMWVGQSERNLGKALDLIRSLSPVIVFIDEIDQSEGSRGESGDSGVGKRIFSKLLQFMSDTSLRGKVLWIAASNRPDLIDAALKRAGRFDMTVPFFLPDRDARLEILRIHFNSEEIDISSITNDEWNSIVLKTKGFTGAELEVVANEAIRRVVDEDNYKSSQIVIESQHIIQVWNNYKPTMNRSTYYKMMALALQDITFVDSLPKEYQNIRIRLVKDPDLINGNDQVLEQLFSEIK